MNFLDASHKVETCYRCGKIMQVKNEMWGNMHLVVLVKSAKFIVLFDRENALDTSREEFSNDMK